MGSSAWCQSSWGWPRAAEDEERYVGHDHPTRCTGETAVVTSRVTCLVPGPEKHSVGGTPRSPIRWEMWFMLRSSPSSMVPSSFGAGAGVLIGSVAHDGFELHQVEGRGPRRVWGGHRAGARGTRHCRHGARLPRRWTLGPRRSVHHEDVTRDHLEQDAGSGLSVTAHRYDCAVFGRWG